MPLTLPIRTGPPLAPDDIVVRGGKMAFRSVLAASRTCFKKYGVWAISVNAIPGATVEQIWAACDTLTLYDDYLVASVADLSDRYELLPTFNSPNHYSLVLPGEFTEAEHASLTGVFTGPHLARQ